MLSLTVFCLSKWKVSVGPVPRIVVAILRPRKRKRRVLCWSQLRGQIRFVYCQERFVACCQIPCGEEWILTTENSPAIETHLISLDEQAPPVASERNLGETLRRGCAQSKSLSDSSTNSHFPSLSRLSDINRESRRVSKGTFHFI